MIPAIFRDQFPVPASAIDANGHVNNVAFVQWMQDVAVKHFETIGGMPAMGAANATWVARSHHIEYLAPAFPGDRIEAETWIADYGRARSRRRYRFSRASDGKELVRAETDWVFISVLTGRPCSIPDSIRSAFEPLVIADRAGEREG